MFVNVSFTNGHSNTPSVPTAASSQPGASDTSSCTVNFTAVVQLQCPPGKQGVWHRVGPANSSVLCNGDFSGQCKYVGEESGLWYSDGGLYYCASTAGDKLQYFVNLTVQGDHTSPHTVYSVVYTISLYIQI